MNYIFEWDEQKARINARKHGITFDEARDVFKDPLNLTVVDHDHSDDETHYYTIGETLYHKLIIVSYVERYDIIRIISARLADRRERRNYENGKFYKPK